MTEIKEMVPALEGEALETDIRKRMENLMDRLGIDPSLRSYCKHVEDRNTVKAMSDSSAKSALIDIFKKREDPWYLKPGEVRKDAGWNPSLGD